MSIDITDLLKYSVGNNASDLHLSAGLMPMIRIDGDMRKLELEPMQHKEVFKLVYDIMNDQQRKELEDTINDYLDNSQELALLFVLVDSRHDIQQRDLDFISTLGRDGIPFSIIYTKCDKQGPNVLKATMDRNAARLLEEWEELPPVFTSSAADSRGKEEILSYIGSILNSYKQ